MHLFFNHGQSQCLPPTPPPPPCSGPHLFHCWRVETSPFLTPATLINLYELPMRIHDSNTEWHSQLNQRGLFCPLSEIASPQLPWWLRWYRIHRQCRRPRFDLWAGKMPWRRKWKMATRSSILAWKIPWTERSLAGYSPWVSESDTTEHTHACNPAHHTPITLLLLLFFSLSCPGECMNNKGSSLYF